MKEAPDIHRLFSADPAGQFEETALSVFRWQASSNPVYRRYLEFLDRNPESVKKTCDIPFLPLSFFKTHPVRCGKESPEIIFTSSATTGSVPSRHEVTHPEIYRESLLKGFGRIYGPAEEYCFLALLPSYLERPGSSLVYMARELMNQSGHPLNGFFLHNLQELRQRILRLEADGQKTLLLGVSFALLDLAALGPLRLKHTLVMETGGMKGRRKEMVREELHEKLKQGLGVEQVHSEYGMTELLSQAYSTGNGIFHTPPWMRVVIRDRYDPFHYPVKGQTGGINVIDLANLYSCSFLETQDLGRMIPGGGFEVIGRFDGSEMRGCNLLAK